MSSSTVARLVREMRSKANCFLDLESVHQCLLALVVGAEISGMESSITFEWGSPGVWRACIRGGYGDAATSIRVPIQFGKHWKMACHRMECQLDYSYAMNAMLASVFNLPKNEIAIWNLQPLAGFGDVFFWTPDIDIQGNCEVKYEQLYLPSPIRDRIGGKNINIAPVCLTTNRITPRIGHIFISDYLFLEVSLDYPIHQLSIALKVNVVEIIILNTANAIHLYSTAEAEVWAVPWISKNYGEDADDVTSCLHETFEWFEAMNGDPPFTQVYGGIMLAQELEPGVYLSVLRVNFDNLDNLGRLFAGGTPLQSSKRKLEWLRTQQELLTHSNSC